MKLKQKIQRDENWLCETCGNKSSMTKQQMLEHLKEVHSIAPPFHGTRTMNMHMDGVDFYSYVFQWKIASVNLSQAIVEPRKKY
jgi:ubiquitin C-terminal hydrolase